MSKFHKSFMIWGYISFKWLVEMEIITSTINAHVYIEILNNFSFLPIQNWFGNDEIIF